MKSQEVNFAAVKQAVAMEAVLRHYQVDDLQGGRNCRDRGWCPIHQSEGRDAFHVDMRRKIFHCFSCGGRWGCVGPGRCAEPVHAVGSRLATARLAPGCGDAERTALEATGYE